MLLRRAILDPEPELDKVADVWAKLASLGESLRICMCYRDFIITWLTAVIVGFKCEVETRAMLAVYEAWWTIITGRNWRMASLVEGFIMNVRRERSSLASSLDTWNRD